MSRRLVGYSLLAPIGCALLICGFGCGHKQQAAPTADKAQPAPVLQVATVSRGTIEQTLPATGTLLALQNQEAAVSPQVTGTLEYFPIHFGQQVQKGEVIAKISTKQLIGQIQQAQATLGQNLVQVQQAEANALQQRAQTRTAILQAQANVRNAQAALAGAQATLTGANAGLQNARANLNRQQTLFNEGLVAQKDVEAAQLAVQTAQAQAAAQQQVVDGQRQTVESQRQAVAAARAASMQDLVKQKDIQVAQQQVKNAQGGLTTARTQMTLYTIHAPLSGQVTVVGATVGIPVDPSTKLCTIANLNLLQLQIGVPSKNAPSVSKGDDVLFTVDSLPGRTFRTKIQAISPQVDPTSGTVQVLAVVTNNGHFLKDDTTVSARIVTARRSNTIVVPESAVLADPNTAKPSVVVIGADNVAHVREVTTGLSASSKVEIVSGLIPGEKVAVSGHYGLPDGTKVTIQQ